MRPPAIRLLRTFSRFNSSSSGSNNGGNGITNGSGQIPQPPKPTKSSTSALDYKLLHPKNRPPSLPEVIDPPKWSAEEAVTNILYNTPPPSREPYTRHVLNALVQNEPGVLSRVSGILAARGFNIDSLVVCATEIKDLSRMCIVLRGQDGVVEQARRQLEDLVPVWAVLNYTRTKTIERELLLAKISILGPEYFEDQLAVKIQSSRKIQGGSTSSISYNSEDHVDIEPNTPAEEMVERQHSALEAGNAIYTHRSPSTPPRSSLTPSEALRQKHVHLQALRELTEIFGAKIVDVSHDALVVEMAGKTSRVDAFLKLVRPYGILEAARSGAMVMPRSRIVSDWTGSEDEEGEIPEDEGGDVDASLLPPG